MLEALRPFALVPLMLGAVACSKAATPEAADLPASASAKDGVFEAFDEACTGTGDLSESVPRAKAKGWTEFSPADGDMLDDYGKMLLSGPVLDRPEVIFLRKNANRAEIVMWETRTLTRSDYIFQCEVIDRNATGLDQAALEDWAKVPIEVRQTGDSPEYLDLKGGRFAEGGGGKATAFFTDERKPNQILTGLQISNFRSSFPEKETK